MQLKSRKSASCLKYTNNKSDIVIYSHLSNVTVKTDLIIKAIHLDNGDIENIISYPVHRNLMIENMDYFAALFREGSNWAENDTEETTVEIQVSNPRLQGDPSLIRWAISQSFLSTVGGKISPF